MVSGKNLLKKRYDVYNLCKELEDLSKKGNNEDKVIYKELSNQIKQKIEE